MFLKLALVGGALAAAAAGGIFVAWKQEAGPSVTGESIAAEELALLEEQDAPPAPSKKAEKAGAGRKHGPPPAAFPNTDDGLPIMQLGVGGIAYWSLEDPFINLFRQMSIDSWAAVKWSGETMRYADMLAAGYIDEETMLPKAVPEGFTFVRSGLFRFGSRYYPEYYGGTYVVEWEGEAAAKCGFGKATKRVGKNRIECFYPSGDRDWSNIEFHEIGEGFANPRLYRKEHEALKDQLFAPQFVDHLHGYKVIRTLDLQGANVSWIRSVDRLATKRQIAWGQSPELIDDQGVVAERIPRSVPIEALFDMAVASDTALWMHVAGIVGAPPAFDDPAVFKGDTNLKERLVRVLARKHAREILASPEWRKYADEIVRSLKASRYPADRMLYIEQANEVWNFAHPFWRNTNYFWGLAEGIKGDNSVAYSWGLGYVTAHFAVIFDEALKEAERSDQAWVSVLAGQMANTETTRSALEGFKAYFAEHRIDATPHLARLGVSTASYYHGVLEEAALPAVIGGSPREGDWTARWLRALASDQATLTKRATEFIISGSENAVGTIPNLIRQRNIHQKLAEDAGAFFLGDYEGESHESGGAPLKPNPAFVNWIENWRAGPEGERLTRAWIEALRKQNPNAIIANFASIGPRDPEGDARNDTHLEPPWIDDFWTEETGKTRALKDYLRPGKSE